MTDPGFRTWPKLGQSPLFFATATQFRAHVKPSARLFIQDFDAREADLVLQKDSNIPVLIIFLQFLQLISSRLFIYPERKIAVLLNT